jgi:hypothetical protein
MEQALSLALSLRLCVFAFNLCLSMRRFEADDFFVAKNEVINTV